MRQLSILSMLLWAVSTCLLITGCEKRSAELPPKSPRPVKTMTLSLTAPVNASNVTGSVKSWKTEQIGFEVGGRLLWVKEPGENIEGQVLHQPDAKDENGADEKIKVVRLGTPLAQIDPAQFQINVESAQASLDVAKLEEKIAESRLASTVVEELNSARADLKLAESDFERIKPLRDQGAISESEFDAVKTRVETQKARVASLEANQTQADAEYNAAKAKVRSAEQALIDAERNLKNTMLYASYNGQISGVDVVPGSVVSAGSPILTLQMMNPIKIEFEVSSEASRIFQQLRQVAFSFELQDGSTSTRKAMVYMVDPSADSSTRTFTVSLLVRNEQNRPEIPVELAGKKIARCQNIWPLQVGEIIENLQGVFLVEKDVIETDAEGDYVWLISGFNFGDTMPEVVKIEKQRVTAGEFTIPFLGNWNFKQVTFADANVSTDGLIAGKLEFPDNPREEWDGETLFFDAGDQWILRPGDIVNVMIDPAQTEPGFYVPVGAIYKDGSRDYVFMVKDNKATRVEVVSNFPDQLDTNSQVRIVPVNTNALVPGIKIVVSGAHYLTDGDEVAVVDGSDSYGGQQ